MVNKTSKEDKFISQKMNFKDMRILGAIGTFDMTFIVRKLKRIISPS